MRTLGGYTSGPRTKQVERAKSVRYHSAMDCPFCAPATDPWIVARARGGTILVDRAPLCLGHLLVVSDAHAASTADLTAGDRRRFQSTVERARKLAARISGLAAIAVEHGRSPTCGTPSRECHAHVHVFPVGEVDANELLSSREPVVPGHPYLAISPHAGRWETASARGAMRHRARVIGAQAAEMNGVAWSPFSMAPDSRTREQTLLRARAAWRGERADSVPVRRSNAASSLPPLLMISGSTGTGKSTLAAHLGRTLDRPVVEVGVMLRLAMLHAATGNAAASDKLWRWLTSGRLDFAGMSKHGLAAAVPRLDGRVSEGAMWTHVDSRALAEFARAPEIAEVIAAMTQSVTGRRGIVVVGRVPIDAAGLDGLCVNLSADAAVRAFRKTRQLSKIGLSPDEHDWFDPHRGAANDAGLSLDTTSLSVDALRRAGADLIGQTRRTLSVA